MISTWEQRKFSECTWNAGKRNKEDLDLEPYAITNEHGFIKQSEAHDDFGYMKDTDRKAYNIVMPNSFAYNPARINVGSIGYYEGTENVIVSSLYEVFQTADYVDDRFLWHWFKSDEFPKWIERLQEGSVRLYFYYDKLCECQMLMPSVPEQKKIAEALDNLDNLITLHQRKLEHVKKMKKSMLQKMFPKKNQLYPEVRFPGFTDAWEQRKLGEIATYRNGKAHEANQLDVGTYELVNLNSISIDGGLKPSGKFIEDGSDTLQRNDLVMVLSDVGHGDLLGRVAIIPENNRYVLNQRVALLRINDDTNTYFLFSIINRYQDYFKKLGAGSSQLNISRGIVENFEVAYPNVAEQRMIADYFQSLDHLITLHQRKQNGRNLK